MLSRVRKAREVINIEIEGLRRMEKRLDGEFDQAISLMLDALNAGRKIIVTGVGKSGQIGQKIAATLTSTGAPSVVLDAVNAMHGDLGVVSAGDLLIALSYSGETEELVRILPSLRRQSVKLVAITGHVRSTVATQADVHLDVSVSKEACPLNLAPTASTTAMLAMGDALAMVLLDARGVKKEDFARFHPGGSIGRHLLYKVEDVMRSLDQLVVLPESATVGQALQMWTAKRAGAVIVVNGRGKLSGIFTHGDFVRHFQTDPQIAKMRLREVMTPGPITVRVDKLAVEVLNLFQKHRIDDLVVVDHGAKPVGLVDAQDLAKFKLI